MHYQAVIFDMGGTLLRYHKPDESWRSFEERGIDSLYWELVGMGFCQRTDREAFVARVFAQLEQGWRAAVAGERNLQLYKIIEQTLREERVPLRQVELDELVAIFVAPQRANLEVNPAALDVLSNLRAHGVKLGLLSNTFWPGDIHAVDLDRFGLLDLIDEARFSSDTKRWKPDPALFLSVSEALGVDPAATIMVGDNPREDILGAQRAGMQTVWLDTGEFALGDVVPDARIERLSEFLAVVAAQTAN